jgi:methylmalonyl-CoA/ethylmalonyl-CoA epimerase
MTKHKTAKQGKGNAATEKPKRGAAFTETMQIGIVVRDLDAAMRHYVDNYGIGPWEVYQIKPADVKEWREHGRPSEPATRAAIAMVGRVQWELIEPLDDKSIFAQFLAATGGGVHHIAVASVDFDETLAAEAKRGKELMLFTELGSKYKGIRVAYLDTQRDLGVPLEVFSGIPDSEQKPGAT